MKEICVSLISEKIAELCLKANYDLPGDIKNKLRLSLDEEETEVCKSALRSIIKNTDAAKKYNIPICQDTGMAVVFADIGQDIHFTGGSFTDAVNEGVRRAYVNGYMRCSVVSDPLERVNTSDNTPAIIHTRIIEGDELILTVAPKGFGSENMSALSMFTPSADVSDIIDFVVSVVNKAGSNPCPPIIVGVGIGGDFEYCALLAKKALVRNIEIRNPKEIYRMLEERILNEINKLGIGAQGFGGSQTALAVNILEAPTHIAGLPVAVNIGCHVTRHETIKI